MSQPTTPFRIEASDRVSQTWGRIEQHLTERLQDLRSQNDADNDERRTAKLRGQIAEVKRILALADDMPQMQVATLD